MCAYVVNKFKAVKLLGNLIKLFIHMANDLIAVLIHTYFAACFQLFSTHIGMP